MVGLHRQHRRLPGDNAVCRDQRDGAHHLRPRAQLGGDGDNNVVHDRLLGQLQVGPIVLLAIQDADQARSFADAHPPQAGHLVRDHLEAVDGIHVRQSLPD